MTKREVKMTGYWPSRSINTEKKKTYLCTETYLYTEKYICALENNFVHWKIYLCTEKYICALKSMLLMY